MDKNKYNILYIDDEENNLIVFKNSFFRYYNIFTALSGKEGLRIIADEEIHLIITDQRMPEMTSLSLFPRSFLFNSSDSLKYFKANSYSSKYLYR